MMPAAPRACRPWPGAKPPPAWRACAENLYRESGQADPARAAVGAWLESPGHRRNLFNAAYTQTGIGVSESPDGYYYVTELFFRP